MSVFEEDSVSMWDSDDELDNEDTNVVKKCHCGHKGKLEITSDGYACENCGYLLMTRK